MLTTSEWDAYVAMVDEIDTLASASVEQFTEAVDFSVLDTSIAEDLFTEYMYDVVARYGDAVSELAVEIYTQALERIGLVPNNPTMATGFSDEYMRQIVNEAFSTLEYDADGNITEEARTNLVEKLKDAVLNAINELKNETMEENARRNQGAIDERVYKRWYAYIPNADACPWCILIASNGWTETKKSETYEFSPLHDNCRCNVVIDYGSYDEIKNGYGYDFEPYKQLYKESKVDGDNLHRPYKTLWQMQKKLDEGELSIYKAIL